MVETKPKHCVVCSSSIYGFWLSLWYLQALLPPGIWLQTADDGHNSLLFWIPACQIKKVVVLFVNIMIIGTCARTRDMHFMHTCTWISIGLCMVLFVFSEVRWEVISNFVDIGGNYHSLNFLYLIINGECTMRKAINSLCHILEICKCSVTLSKVSLHDR